MGIFGPRIRRVYARRDDAPTAAPAGRSPVAILSPWAPASNFEKWAIDDALRGNLDQGTGPLTREAALRIPAINRAHGIVCTQYADIPKFLMKGDQRAATQLPWLTTTESGVAPYHRDYGAASDWFFEGWACFGFTEDKDDCVHVPYGMWGVDENRRPIITDDRVPAEYRAYLVAIPLGYGENGILHDAADTIRQAQKIEQAYQHRLDNPIALTVLSVDDATYYAWSDEDRAKLRDDWNEGRRQNSTGLKPKGVDVDFPGAGASTDLYESGRNAVRLDLANHCALPASMVEGVRQGGSGGGTEMRYQGVGENGVERSDVWEYGKAKRMLQAFEARMSLDDICAPGLSIRGDLSAKFATPNPPTNPTSED
jgi:hypothetical protein